MTAPFGSSSLAPRGRLPTELFWHDVSGDAIVESARRSLSVRVETANVAAFDVVHAPVDEPALFDPLLGGARSAARVSALPGSVTAHVKSSPRRNVTASTRFELPTRRGNLAVATSAPGLPDDVRLLSFTDLGIIRGSWSRSARCSPSDACIAPARPRS